MIIQKSTTAICHSSGPSLFSPLSAAITSPCRSRGRASTSRPQSRALASVSSARDERPHPSGSGASPSHGSDTPWPTALHPTPYEIFSQSAAAPYSKLRFLELVKLYHPDRHHHTSHDTIPHRTKLERYRLVVAANSILCDPERRKLYDRYGAGWEGPPPSSSPPYGNDGDTLRSADRAWRRKPNNASMNATWEDWEQWYERRDGREKQAPIFVSNGGFVGIVALLALIGGWGHVNRAGTNAAKLMDIREEEHVRASKVIRQRQTMSAGLSKEDRVKFFLQQREGWGDEPPVGGHPPPDIRPGRG